VNFAGPRCAEQPRITDPKKKLLKLYRQGCNRPVGHTGAHRIYNMIAEVLEEWESPCT
jgi:hypothetical protein